MDLRQSDIYSILCSSEVLELIVGDRGLHRLSVEIDRRRKEDFASQYRLAFSARERDKRSCITIHRSQQEIARQLSNNKRAWLWGKMMVQVPASPCEAGIALIEDNNEAGSAEFDRHAAECSHCYRYIQWAARVRLAGTLYVTGHQYSDVRMACRRTLAIGSIHRGQVQVFWYRSLEERLTESGTAPGQFLSEFERHFYNLSLSYVHKSLPSPF